MPNTQRIDIETEIVELLAQRDLPMISVPSRTTAAGSTTTLKDRVLGRGTGTKSRFDGRVIKIIEDVADDFTNAATVDGAHNATVTTLAVDDAQDIEIGHVLEVDGSEKMLVTNIATNDLTVERGHLGTTAAAYTGGETVHFAFLGCVVAVDDGGFDETDELAVSPAFPIAPPSGMEYLPYPKGLTPEIVTKAISRVLVATDALHRWAPSLVPDSDMSENDLTKWSAVGSPSTREFVTAAGHVLFGPRALHLVGNSGTGARCTIFDTHEGELLLISVPVKATNEDYNVILYDEANGVNIKAVNIDNAVTGGWVDVRFLETIPTATIATRASLRFIAGATAAILYVSPHVIVQSARRRAYDAPDWLLGRSQVLNLLYQRQGYSAEADDAYIPLSSEMVGLMGLDFLRSDYDIHPLRVVLSAPIGLGPIYLECLRPFAELSYDTETTPCDAEYLKYKAISLILNDRKDGDGRDFARKAASRADTLRYGERGIRIEESQVYV